MQHHRPAIDLAQIPSYEPIKYNGKDALTPAQKAQMQQIHDLALAAMERHHVSVWRIDQFLWQMHFFVPVHYKPFDCSTLKAIAPFNRNEPFLISKGAVAERVNDFVAVGAAMREVHDAYPLALPMHNPDADAHSRVVPNNLHIDDRLETYSLQMWSYMWEYRRWSGDFVYANGHYELKYFPGFNNPEIEHEINIIDRGFVTSPFSKICSSKGRIFKINGISDNDKIIKDGFDPPYTPGAADDRWPVDANPGGK